MNIKQFLKPDWKRLLVFIFLPIVVGFVTEIFLFNFQLSQEAIKIISIIVHPFLNITVLFLPSVFFTLEQVNTKIIIETISSILDSFYLYIISCFIVWIYNNIRKKK
jgi:hypothetical protein